MKIKKLLCLVLAILLLCLSGCGEAPTPTEPSETIKKEEPEVKEISILFIGNSYTYYNDMPNMIFKKMAEAAGYETKIKYITKGGHKLSQFADLTYEYGEKVEAALTGSTKYDFVILQEQSVRPATEDAPDFYGAVRNLSARIRKTGATPVLYATWGRKTGSDTLETYGWTNEEMTWRLAAAYQAIGNELEIDVAHVGVAFFDVYTNHSDIELYDPDKTHPSYAGSYLAAATLFAKIFNEDPTELTFKGSLSEEYATILLEAARKAVFETPGIPKPYLTSSKGVG